MSLNLESASDFKGDPYGYVTNQISHIYLGFSLTCFYVFLLDLLYFYPDQIIASFVVVIFYLICWELLLQGFKGWDTIEDTLFVALGVSPFFLIEFETVLNRVVFFLIISWLLLVPGLARRVNKDGRG